MTSVLLSRELKPPRRQSNIVHLLKNDICFLGNAVCLEDLSQLFLSLHVFGIPVFIPVSVGFPVFVVVYMSP